MKRQHAKKKNEIHATQQTTHVMSCIHGRDNQHTSLKPKNNKRATPSITSCQETRASTPRQSSEQNGAPHSVQPTGANDPCHLNRMDAQNRSKNMTT